MEEEKQ